MDYVRAQWLILQQPEAEDYVIATGEQRSVREFVEYSARELGIGIKWQGEGDREVGVVTAVEPVSSYPEVAAHAAIVPGSEIVRIDRRYFRPSEVETLLGDASKAKTRLGWEPEIGFDQLVTEMIASDFGHEKSRAAAE